MDTATEPRFSKGERVVLDIPGEGPLFHGRTGTIMRKPQHKRPRGKTLGWWYVVHVDPPKGLKTVEAEVAESCLRAAEATR